MRSHPLRPPSRHDRTPKKAHLPPRPARRTNAPPRRRIRLSGPDSGSYHNVYCHRPLGRLRSPNQIPLPFGRMGPHPNLCAHRRLLYFLLRTSFPRAHSARRPSHEETELVRLVIYRTAFGFRLSVPHPDDEVARPRHVAVGTHSAATGNPTYSDRKTWDYDRKS